MYVKYDFLSEAIADWLQGSGPRRFKADILKWWPRATIPESPDIEEALWGKEVFDYLTIWMAGCPEGKDCSIFGCDTAIDGFRNDDVMLNIYDTLGIDLEAMMEQSTKGINRVYFNFNLTKVDKANLESITREMVIDYLETARPINTETTVQFSYNEENGYKKASEWSGSTEFTGVSTEEIVDFILNSGPTAYVDYPDGLYDNDPIYGDAFTIYETFKHYDGTDSDYGISPVGYTGANIPADVDEVAILDYVSDDVWALIVDKDKEVYTITDTTVKFLQVKEMRIQEKDCMYVAGCVPRTESYGVHLVADITYKRHISWSDPSVSHVLDKVMGEMELLLSYAYNVTRGHVLYDPESGKFVYTKDRNSKLNGYANSIKESEFMLQVNNMIDALLPTGASSILTTYGTSVPFDTSPDNGRYWRGTSFLVEKMETLDPDVFERIFVDALTTAYREKSRSDLEILVGMFVAITVTMFAVSFGGLAGFLFVPTALKLAALALEIIGLESISLEVLRWSAAWDSMFDALGPIHTMLQIYAFYDAIATSIAEEALKEGTSQALTAFAEGAADEAIMTAFTEGTKVTANTVIVGISNVAASTVGIEGMTSTNTMEIIGGTVKAVSTAFNLYATYVNPPVWPGDVPDAISFNPNPVDQLRITALTDINWWAEMTEQMDRSFLNMTGGLITDALRVTG